MGRERSPRWTCPGCGFRSSQPDSVVNHVRYCDKVDGKGESLTDVETKPIGLFLMGRGRES